MAEGVRGRQGETGSSREMQEEAGEGMRWQGMPTEAVGGRQRQEKAGGDRESRR